MSTATRNKIERIEEKIQKNDSRIAFIERSVEVNNQRIDAEESQIELLRESREARIEQKEKQLKAAVARVDRLNETILMLRNNPQREESAVQKRIDRFMKLNQKLSLEAAALTEENEKLEVERSELDASLEEQEQGG